MDEEGEVGMELWKARFRASVVGGAALENGDWGTSIVIPIEVFVF